MISARMSRPIRVLLIMSASATVVALATACGTQKITVPKSDPTYQGAVLFSQRCSGCHTLAYAGTRGSAKNARTREITNGPSFDVRCERPVTRVLYAIENGGFSGAIMPANVVVGQDAIAVAQFVAKYAGRQAAKIVGQPLCDSQPVGSIPPRTGIATIASTTPTPSPATTSTTTTQAASGGRAKKKTSH
jgi:mono/diheme cytochrome c family protein